MHQHEVRTVTASDYLTSKAFIAYVAPAPMQLPIEHSASANRNKYLHSHK